MVAKIKFIPKSKTILGMRNALNDTHATLNFYQDCLIDEFLFFLKEDGKGLTFRRLLAEAKEYFGKYSAEISGLNPNSYSEEQGKELVKNLLVSMKSKKTQNNQQAFV